MRQGITTRYIGPSNTRGSRIKAIARKRDNWGPEQGLTVDRRCELSVEANHTRAAMACAKKLEWWGLWVGAGTHTQDGFHYVNLGASLTPASIAGHSLPHHPLGKEGEDWFYLPHP